MKGCTCWRKSRTGKDVVIVLGLESDTLTYPVIGLNNSVAALSVVIKHYQSRTVIHRDWIAIFEAVSTKALPPETIESWYRQPCCDRERTEGCVIGFPANISMCTFFLSCWIEYSTPRLSKDNSNVNPKSAPTVERQELQLNRRCNVPAGEKKKGRRNSAKEMKGEMEWVVWNVPHAEFVMDHYGMEHSLCGSHTLNWIGKTHFLVVVVVFLKCNLVLITIKQSYGGCWNVGYVDSHYITLHYKKAHTFCTNLFLILRLRCTVMVLRSQRWLSNRLTFQVICLLPGSFCERSPRCRFHHLDPQQTEEQELLPEGPDNM